MCFLFFILEAIYLFIMASTLLTYKKKNIFKDISKFKK